jgi:putative endonuclease
MVRFHFPLLNKSFDNYRSFIIFISIMVYIYVIKSLKNGLHYTGMTIELNNRLNEHNSGKSKFTKAYMPWQLIYSETQADWTNARLREKYLKSAAGKRWLEKQINSPKVNGSLPD